mgnify:CR=1 FL=1
MCFKKRCFRCAKSYNKKELYYHKHYDKYYNTWWCNECLINHINRINLRHYKLLM